ncbi:unnamed protein product (macronuclear) [Paramecium tetraurelia]|uniref:Dynein light chain n=1 Tax=Paramecium tetraurelia TaxID=5888 RepID=A0E219_PARTE|nr:uncharacterized protein GSPATT00022507001 [Paramecium tetraurelia]CAK89336.1 unnamed protein product [Paramecium tetraurelia]|eukprot:XP_001456733.1 hypothetical protein (macronuclear) [Paramecium tetraurelia strain d4-2]
MSQIEETLKKYPKYMPTLVRYEEPIEINEDEMQLEMQEQVLNQKKKQQLQPLDQKWSIDEILNKFFPPRRFEHEAHFFKQVVSVNDVKRDELNQLEAELDQRLIERQARKSGICPVREDLHSQLFEEIIRQSAINCPERGLLLMRVYDNLKLTFAAYQTLYAGSVVFGNRKAAESEIGKSEQDSKIADYDKKKIYLENQKILLENELDAIQRSFKEIRELEEKRMESEMQFLKQQTKHLEHFLKQVQQNQQ